jgi:hypothetical protein
LPEGSSPLPLSRGSKRADPPTWARRLKKSKQSFTPKATGVKKNLLPPLLTLDAKVPFLMQKSPAAMTFAAKPGVSGFA